MPKIKSEEKKGEILIYRSKEGPKIDVRLEDESVWLTQKQMSALFDKDVRTINQHIKNVYREKELEQNRTIRNFRIT